jgi:hypothetical protein
MSEVFSFVKRNLHRLDSVSDLVPAGFRHVAEGEERDSSLVGDVN